MYVYTHIKYVIYIILSNTERDLEASVLVALNLLMSVQCCLFSDLHVIVLEIR
jgi:hypothetical protein